MGIIDDYAHLRMIDNIKRLKELEICYESNLKLCKFQEKQINRLATALEDIKFTINSYCSGCKQYEPDKSCQYCIYNRILKIIKNVR